jgi:hypothetical protein
MLSVATRELVAAEGHYHRSCYRTYTRNTVNSGETPAPDDSVDEYEMAEKEAIDELFIFIRQELMQSPQIVPMTELTARVVGSLNGLGFDEIKHSTKKHMRRTLEQEHHK